MTKKEKQKLKEEFKLFLKDFPTLDFNRASVFFMFKKQMEFDKKFQEYLKKEIIPTMIPSKNKESKHYKWKFQKINNV